jgi:hypothetical protein
MNFGPRLNVTNWARIENLNIPSRGALATAAAKPRLVKGASVKPLAPAGKVVTLRTFRVAA